MREALTFLPNCCQICISVLLLFCFKLLIVFVLINYLFALDIVVMWRRLFETKVK